MPELKVWFDHGLGDCCHFAALLQLYRRRGYEVGIHYEPNKAAIWKAAGVKWLPLEEATHHPWEYPSDFGSFPCEESWAGSKLYWNMDRGPMSPLGDKQQLWAEWCEVRLSARDVVSQDDHRDVDRFIAALPRPLVLLHTRGSNMAASKNLNGPTILELYRLLLDRTGGSLLLLDWEEKVPRLAHARVRHLRDDWEHLSLEKLWCLMESADLFIGIDSGPYHFTALTDIPAVGIWRNHHPAQCGLPRPATVNLVRSAMRFASIPRRADWNLVDYAGTEPTAEEIMRVAEQVLLGPRYLCRNRLGRDVQLQHFIERCRQTTPVSAHADRHRSFNRLLRETSHRFDDPVIVETGCIRAPEDWSAGYSTYVLAAYLAGRGAGSLHSVDIDPVHLEFARHAVMPFGARVSFHQADSIAWLSEFSRRIDVLYLDSRDFVERGADDHGLAEVEAAFPRLSADSLVLIDDTVWNRGWQGKGAKAVPWLTARGWRILESGYQILLSKR